MAGAVKENTMTVYQDQEGWRIEYLDPSHIQMMRLRIPAEAFEGYIPGDAFGLSTERLAKALNALGDTVDITVGDRLSLAGGGVRMNLPKYDAGDAVKWPPLNDFTSECVFSSDLIRRMSDASPDEADNVEFVISENGLSFVSEDGTGVGSAELTVPADECVMCEGGARGRYAWHALRTFLKGLPKGTEMDMRMSEDYPLNVRFGTEGGLRGEWFLAPWIVAEE